MTLEQLRSTQEFTSTKFWKHFVRNKVPGRWNSEFQKRAAPPVVFQIQEIVENCF